MKLVISLAETKLAVQKWLADQHGVTVNTESLQVVISNQTGEFDGMEVELTEPLQPKG